MDNLFWKFSYPSTNTYFQGRLLVFITFFTFSYRLFLPRLLKHGGPGGTTFLNFLTLQALNSNLITKLCFQ